jgi:hypothetical protein
MTMTATRTITVEQVEERTSQKGQRYWRVKVAGERQSLFCWDPALAQALEPGMTYQVVVNGTSDYPRIIDVTLLPDAAPTPAPAPAPATAVSERERRMLRMSALRVAGDVLHGSHVPAVEITKYAEQLLMWLEG